MGSGRCALCLVGGRLCDVIVGWWDVGGGRRGIELKFREIYSKKYIPERSRDLNSSQLY